MAHTICTIKGKYSPYNGAITQEQFLFYEMRITARLLVESGADEEVVDRIIAENLYQYPSEHSLTGQIAANDKRDKILSQIAALQKKWQAKSSLGANVNTLPRYQPLNLRCHEKA